MADIELNQGALTKACRVIEDRLSRMRDIRLSVIGPSHGFVINEKDGTSSNVMRIGTRDGLEIAIKAYLAALEK
jgi:hypothetical protein